MELLRIFKSLWEFPHLFEGGRWICVQIMPSRLIASIKIKMQTTKILPTAVQTKTKDNFHTVLPPPIRLPVLNNFRDFGFRKSRKKVLRIPTIFFGFKPTLYLQTIFTKYKYCGFLRFHTVENRLFDSFKQILMRKKRIRIHMI